MSVQALQRDTAFQVRSLVCPYHILLLNRLILSVCERLTLLLNG